MDGRILGRLAAASFVALAITATVLEVSHKDRKADGTAAPLILAPDRVREHLRQCQHMGEAASRDGDCLRLWSQQRDRFLGFAPPYADLPAGHAAPEDVMTEKAP